MSMCSRADSPTRTRICLWCTPRSGSTALTKCLSAIADAEVWFEPYCYCFVYKTEASRQLGLDQPEEFRHARILALQNSKPSNPQPKLVTYDSVTRMLESASSRRVFMKDAAYTITKEQFPFLPKGYKHTFLIRHPHQVLRSHRELTISHLAELGLLTMDPVDFDLEVDHPYISPGHYFGEVYDLWRHVRANIDPSPVIIDGDELLSRPAEVLPKYCDAVGLPFSESMLKWDASPDYVMESWKTPSGSLNDRLESTMMWYERALRSSEFLPPRPLPLEGTLSPDVIRCGNNVMKYYNEMFEHRLQA